MDFDLTRTENDETLLSQIDSIRAAKNINVLVPFAKAYLGMFYVIDKALPAKEKVRLITNEKLAEAIFSGFIASLSIAALPSIEKIAHKKAEQQEFAEGYVILAGLDLISANSVVEISTLSQETIEKAVGFYLSNNTGHQSDWFNYLLDKHKEKIILSLSKFWVALLKNKASYLPRQNLLLGNSPDSEVVNGCVLPTLEHWANCKPKTLIQLLVLAFRYGDINELLVLCEHKLKDEKNLSEQIRLYWIASAYLLSPEKHFSLMSNYIGRVKLKVMPLLDFVILLMFDNNKLNLKAKTLTQLLRIIAPIFPPQHHVYGALRGLDINSKNVMLMFYQLLLDEGDSKVKEIKALRRARVMKIYSPVIDDLLELIIRKGNSDGFVLPSFDLYLENLVNNNCLQGRTNKFDLN